VSGRDDGHTLRESGLGDTIEMVAVILREKDEVERGQLLDLDGRVG
jgi:hypothetical protein